MEEERRTGRGWTCERGCGWAEKDSERRKGMHAETRLQGREMHVMRNPTRLPFFNAVRRGPHRHVAYSSRRMVREKNGKRRTHQHECHTLGSCDRLDPRFLHSARTYTCPRHADGQYIEQLQTARSVDTCDRPPCGAPVLP